MWRAALVLALTACWRTEPAVEAPHLPPQERLPTTFSIPHRAVVQPPLTEMGELFAKVDEFTADMCRCADNACTQQVMNGIMQWFSEWQVEHPDFKPSEEESRDLQEAATTLTNCASSAGARTPQP